MRAFIEGKGTFALSDGVCYGKVHKKGTGEHSCFETKMTDIKNKLGNGLLTVKEAALYARVPVAKMNRWVFGSNKENSVITPQFGTGDKEDRVVSFLDFVQTLAIREIRVVKKIPLRKIRQAMAMARDKYHVDYPFAMKNFTYWNGREIVICPEGNAEGGIIQASGKGIGQRYFSFAWIYLDKLGFDDSGMCNVYRIYQRNNDIIKMSPHLRFGEPLLESGYSASFIWEAIQVEGGVENASNAYSIPISQVQTAYNFYVDYLQKSAA